MKARRWPLSRRHRGGRWRIAERAGFAIFNERRDPIAPGGQRLGIVGQAEEIIGVGRDVGVLIGPDHGQAQGEYTRGP